MSKSNSNSPWKNGFWYNKDSPVMITHVDGEIAAMKNLVCLDYPEAKDMMNGTWTFGDFGPADAKMVELTGVQNYNFMSEFNKAFRFQGTGKAQHYITKPSKFFHRSYQ